MDFMTLRAHGEPKQTGAYRKSRSFDYDNRGGYRVRDWDVIPMLLADIPQRAEGIHE